jgi:hypothetical protein
VTLTRLTAIVLALGAAALALPGCGDDGNCSPGEDCHCDGSDGDECFLECEGDGCVQLCGGTTRCGGVCEDNCRIDCGSVRECSAFCGDDCSADCRDAAHCEAVTGADSRVVCHRADRCGAEVGPGSRVECSDAASCIILCHGDCVVECDRLGRPCEVYCGSRSASPRLCDGGTTCGCS